MDTPSGARPNGGRQAGRHLRMIIRDSGSLWQRLRRVIRISVVDQASQEMVDAAEGLPRFA